MSIFDVLVCNFLLISGHCKSVAEALEQQGRERQRAEETIRSFIESFARDLDLLGGGKGKADLWMGVNNLPLDKQYSLRLFKRDVKPHHVIHAIHHQYDREYRFSMVDELSHKKVIEYYQFIEPMFILLGIRYQYEDILNEFEEYKQK